MMFLLNVLLALAWMFLWSSFDVWTLGAGLLLGFVVLAPISAMNQKRKAAGGDSGPSSAIPKSYASRSWRLIRFGVYFIRILVKANWDVAKVVLTPGFGQKSCIIRYPVGDLSDLQLTVLANAITLTPGTLSMDVSDDKTWLYVHCMIGHDREALMNDITDLRNRILEDFL
jgi:multicomponent Na+:H+ antiporter subunit E